MMSQDEFKNVLFDMGCNFDTQIKPKFKEIFIATMKSCQKSIEIRKNSFEVFGLDFIIDE